MLIALGCALLGSAFLMSNHYVPWTSFEPQWVAGLGAALVGAGALLPEYAPADRRYRVPPIAYGAMALAAVPVLQWIFGLVVFRSDSLLAATYLAAFAATVVVGRQLAAAPSVRFLPWLQAALLFGALASALIALLQWLRIDVPTMHVLPLGPGGRPSGNLAQPNHLASLLCLGLAATAYLYESRRLGSAASAAFVALLGWALVLTQSRAGWLMIGLLGVWWLVQRRRAALLVPWPVVGAAALLFIAGIVLEPLLTDALLLSAEPGAGPRLHAGTRLLHWASLWDAALRQPWFGYGWGQVSQAQVAVVLDYPASGEWVQNSHNLLLDLLIHNGMPIGFTVAALLVVWFMRRIRACRTGEQWALLAGVGMVFVHTTVEFPLDYIYFLLPIGLMMGALHALEEPKSDSSERIIRRDWFALSVLGLFAMLVWIGVEYMTVERAARQFRFVVLGVGVDKVSHAPEPDVWLLDQPREFHRFLNTRARAGMSSDEMAFMRRNVGRAARPATMMRFALALGLNGQHAESAQWLVRICKMHPVKRCDEGRATWAAAKVHFPVLQPIPYPDTPTELLQSMWSPIAASTALRSTVD
jgi:O-antigen ligase